MKSLQWLAGVILVSLSTTSWAFFGLFTSYSDEEKVKDLSQATRWMIENGPYLYVTEGDDVLKKKLKENISEKLRNNIKLKLVVNAQDNKREFMGGGIFGLFIENNERVYEGYAKVIYRTEIHGELYEFWNSIVIYEIKKFKVQDKRKYKTPAMSFFVVRVNKRMEKREILHESNRFFEKFEIVPGIMFKLPMEQKKLLDALQPDNERRRQYFIGSSLENVRSKLVNGKYQYVKVDVEEERLEERKRKLKLMEGVAGYFPVYGIQAYKESGKQGILDQLSKIKKLNVEPEFTYNKSLLKQGEGQVFTVKAEGVSAAVHLIKRTEVDGVRYEYWLFNSKEVNEKEPLQRLRFAIIKVDANSEQRELLKDGEQPYTGYTTESGTELTFPTVDKALLE